MNTKKLTIAAFAAIIAASATFADKGQFAKNRPSPETLVATMIGTHDKDQDGALNDAELAAPIEELFEQRNQAVRNHRDTMVEQGIIASEKGDNGFITLTPMPQDAAGFLINGHDTTANQVLEADELLASTRDFRQLNLGFRPGFARES